MLRRTLPMCMKYADFEIVTRGEFPHGMKEPEMVKMMDKHIPEYFIHHRSQNLWPVMGDGWTDLNEGEKRHDLHMFYTLAWWKLGEGIVDESSWGGETEMEDATGIAPRKGPGGK